MRATGFLALAAGLVLVFCNQSVSAKRTTVRQNETLQQTDSRQDRTKDQEDIQNLIRQVLEWADSKDCIELLPMLTDNQGNVYTGFDLEKHRSDLGRLMATGFFANEFIENYNLIILTLDRKLKDHEFGEWLVGDLPPFRFASGTNPWCGCQDVPYDEPSPWEEVEIEVIGLDGDSAQLIWKWGGLHANTDPGWKEFSYKFRTVKEGGRWKIAYLQEFDLAESTGNGE